MNPKAFKSLASLATPVEDVEVGKFVTSVYPYYDVRSMDSHIAVAFITRVIDRTDRARVTEHTVVISYREDNGVGEFGLSCADKFIDGELTVEEMKNRAFRATRGLAASPKHQQAIVALFGSHSASGSCNFWTNWRQNKEMCRHTRTALHALFQQYPDFTKQMVYGYQKIVSEKLQEENTLSLAELAFRVPVLFEGERGAGKTKESRDYARRNNFKCVEVGGHEGLESTDMLGYLVPYGAGQMVWKDGPLSQAFRLATKQPVVLIIDELLRIRMRELSILLTALSPDDGVYRLRTGRILEVVDGVAEEEILECDVSNLCVIATTNVGAGYAVDELDLALAERFVILRKDTSVAELTKILNDCAVEKNFDESAVTKAISFFSKMVEARNQGVVVNIPSTRTMVRAFELANRPEDIVRVLRTHHLLWVSRDADGYPVAEQVDFLMSLLKRIYGE